MTYVKLSSDFVSIESLSRISQLPTSVIEQYFNNLFKMASQVEDVTKDCVDEGLRRLSLYMELDRLGVDQVIIEDIIKAYVDSAGDFEGLSIKLSTILTTSLSDNGVTKDLYTTVMSTFNPGA